jgi:hypothetical protein
MRKRKEKKLRKKEEWLVWGLGEEKRCRSIGGIGCWTEMEFMVD